MNSSVSLPIDDGWQPHLNDTYVGGMGDIYERTRNGLIEIGLGTDDRHKNLSGIVHGGVVMALIDRTVGLNCRAVAQSEPTATATLTVNFLRPIRVSEFLAVRCTLKKTGRKAIFADAEACVGDRLVATATGMWLMVG